MILWLCDHYLPFTKLGQALEVFYWIWFRSFIEILNIWSWAEPCAAPRAVWRRFLLNRERLVQRGMGLGGRTPHWQGNERVSAATWSRAAEGLWIISSNHCMGKLGLATHVRTPTSEFYCHWTVIALTMRVTIRATSMHALCMWWEGISRGLPTCLFSLSSLFSTKQRYELIFSLLPPQADDEIAEVLVVTCWYLAISKGEHEAGYSLAAFGLP